MPLKVVTDTEILSKYAYSTSKNIEALFKESKKTGAILVIELTMDDKTGGSINHLLYSIEHYNGTVIVITNLDTLIDDALLRRFKFVLEFKLPEKNQRDALWKKLIPDKVPCKDVDTSKLAAEYDYFTGGNIENVIFRACSRAALSSDQVLTQKMIVAACEEELKFSGKLSKTDAKSIYQ